MPGSNRENDLIIEEWFESIRKRTVLDVGCGRGRYARTFRLDNEEWVGVEVWASYIEKFSLHSLYDEIIVADIAYLDEQYFRKDLVIFGDVLEHMEPDVADYVVRRAIAKSGHILISIPTVYYPQGEVFENPYERHIKDDWCHEDVMSTWGEYVLKYHNGVEVSCYLLEGQ